ncbi:MAG: nucleotidyltransferase [Opitutales bacterium]
MVHLLQLLEILAKAEIEFVLVGGVAAYAYGSPMVTQDLDICGDLSTGNVVRLAKALGPYGPKHRMSPTRPAFTVEQAETERFNNIYLATDIGQVDFLGQIKGVGDYDAAFRASEPVSMGDFETRILSLAKLIDAKEAMGRPRDLETASILKEIRDETN